MAWQFPPGESYSTAGGEAELSLCTRTAQRLYHLRDFPKQIAVLLATRPSLSPERKQPKDKETLPFQLTFLLSLKSRYCSIPA